MDSLDRKLNENSRLKHNQEHVEVVWLDGRANEGSEQIRLILKKCDGNSKLFRDHDECIDFIKSLDHGRLLMFVSDVFFIDDFLRKIEHCRVKLNLIDLSKQIDSLRVGDDPDLLQRIIEKEIRFFRRQSITVNLFDFQQRSMRNLSKESASFLWNQILVHILQEFPRNEHSRQDIITKCMDIYRDNPREFQKIEEFQSSYKAIDAIRWYTEECFLYKELNKALRTEDFQMLYIFRTFITDLIDALCRERSEAPFETIPTTLYRGQQLTDQEFERLVMNIGSILSFNAFLSTTRDIQVALAYAGRAIQYDHLRYVLFEIEIDPSKSSLVFADVSNKSRIHDEQEVLFSLNSTFKLLSVLFDPLLSLWRIRIEAVTESSDKSQEYIQVLRQQMGGYSPSICFGRLLLVELGQIDKAAEYFDLLLKTLPIDHSDVADIQNALGHVYYAKNEMKQALSHYEKGHALRREQLTNDHLRIAYSLENLANVHRQMNDFDRAIHCYQQANEIRQRNGSTDDMRAARASRDLAKLHISKNDYDKACLCLRKSCDIYARLSIDQHPEVAESLHLLGMAHQIDGSLNDAIEYYQKGLSMREICLPVGHRDIDQSISSIARVYQRMGKVDLAVAFLKEKLQVQHEILGDIHLTTKQTDLLLKDLLGSVEQTAN